MSFDCITSVIALNLLLNKTNNYANKQLVRNACDGRLRLHGASCRANAMALHTTIPELIGKGLVVSTPFSLHRPGPFRNMGHIACIARCEIRNLRSEFFVSFVVGGSGCEILNRRSSLSVSFIVTIAGCEIRNLRS